MLIFLNSNSIIVQNKQSIQIENALKIWKTGQQKDTWIRMKSMQCE